MYLGKEAEPHHRHLPRPAVYPSDLKYNRAPVFGNALGAAIFSSLES